RSFCRARGEYRTNALCFERKVGGCAGHRYGGVASRLRLPALETHTVLLASRSTASLTKTSPFCGQCVVRCPSCLAATTSDSGQRDKSRQKASFSAQPQGSNAREAVVCPGLLTTTLGWSRRRRPHRRALQITHSSVAGFT